MRKLLSVLAVFLAAGPAAAAIDLQALGLRTGGTLPDTAARFVIPTALTRPGTRLQACLPNLGVILWSQGLRRSCLRTGVDRLKEDAFQAASSNPGRGLRQRR